ncbi:MAG: hypothetical protein J5685_11535 [Clostridiales bacterium]|nr:hypothetical protein [Clostridiales bacterium]
MNLKNSSFKNWIRSGVTGFFVLIFSLVALTTKFPESDILLMAGISLVLTVISVLGLYYILSRKNVTKDPVNWEYKGNYPFSFMVSFITIMIFSQSSPLYPFNNWVDPNCFFTVGSCVLKGLVPYRDLYEQKGPLLYFLHTLAALISSDTFFGVFIIQVISCSFVHFFAMKTAALYTKISRTSYIASIPLLFLSFSVISYYFGDSSEEFLFPFYSATLYIILKAIRKKIYPSVREIILIGLGAASAFWIKYTLCGYFVAVILFLIIFGFFRKEYKKIAFAALYFGAVCLAVSGLILLYFATNHAVNDLFTAYFFNNLQYGEVTENVSILGRIPYTITLTFIRLADNLYFAVMILIASVVFMLKGKKGELPFYLGALFLTALFIFMGSFQGFYYPFALAVFTIPAWSGIFILAEKIRCLPVTVALSTGLCICAFFLSASTPSILSKREDMPQYIFAEYINRSESPTLLNYNFLDQGFYTVSGVLPTEKHFCELNIDLVISEGAEARDAAIEQGRVEFVVTKNEEFDWDNYELVAYADWSEKDFDNELWSDRFYLYQRID